MRSDVVQAIGDLIKSGNADTAVPSYTLPGFKTDDIYPIFKKYLNAPTQQAMDVKTSDLLHQRNRMIAPSGFFSLLKKLDLKSCSEIEDDKEGVFIREVDLVHFCCSRADKPNLQAAVMKVVRTLNELGQRGYITATLVPLSVVAIKGENEINPEYVVISYVALTRKGSDYAKNQFPKMFIKEAEMPERFENQ